MGIRWLLVPMQSAEAMLAIKPNIVEFERLLRKAQVNGVMPFGPQDGMEEQYEVHGLLIEQGSLREDPVTGRSANACLARYLQTQRWIRATGFVRIRRCNVRGVLALLTQPACGLVDRR